MHTTLLPMCEWTFPPYHWSVDKNHWFLPFLCPVLNKSQQTVWIQTGIPAQLLSEAEL